MLGHILRHIRVVTWYMGSGMKGLHRGGIRDHSPGILDHNRWDRDQQFIYLFIYLLNSITQMINIKIKNKFRNKR